jgi:hypothetical protein
MPEWLGTLQSENGIGQSASERRDGFGGSPDLNSVGHNGAATNLLRSRRVPRTSGPGRRPVLNQPEARRLYEISRDRYAPVLMAFATEWLEELVHQPRSIALCLGRDGIAPFLAARTLLKINPCRFPGVHPHRVRLAYISRALARGAMADLGQAALLDIYLRGRGLTDANPLMLVDVGIHGSIQDCLRQVYPKRTVSGRYLVLRRRSGDPNGAFKRGFLAELDVAPSCPLQIGPSGPPLPDSRLGGTLRRGDPLFLRPRSVHVLEDLWNGVSEGAERFQVSACGERVMVIRSRSDQVLALSSESKFTPMHRAGIKRAALRGVVDGVAQGRTERVQSDAYEAIYGLASWLGELDHPDPLDAHLLSAFVRRGNQQADDDADMDAADKQ